MCDLVSSGKFAAVRKLDTEGFVRLVELVTQRWDAVSDFSFWSHRMPSDWRCLVEPVGTVPEAMSWVGACVLRHSYDLTLAPEASATYLDGF